MSYKHYFLGDELDTCLHINWETQSVRLSVESAAQCVKLSYNTKLDALEKDLKTVLNDVERWRRNNEPKGK